MNSIRTSESLLKLNLRLILFRIRFVLPPVALLGWSLFGNVQAASPHEPFAIADYFLLQRPVELALSSDGKWLAFVVENTSLKQNRTIRKLFVRSLEQGAVPVQLESLDDAHSLQWIPNTAQLAFESSLSGSPQVHSIDVSSHTMRQWTHAPDSVASFRFSINGSRLAYLTHATPEVSQSLSAQLESGTKGILLDTSTIDLSAFLESTSRSSFTAYGRSTSSPGRLWVTGVSGPPAQISIAGDVERFYWAPDDRRMSVTFIADNVPWSYERGQFSSIGIVELSSGQFLRTFAGTAPSKVGGDDGVGYEGGEWLPNGKAVLVRRMFKNHPWLREHYPEWAVASVRASSDHLSWSPLEDYNAKYTPVSSTQILMQDTRRGISSLFTLGVDDERASDLVKALEGNSSLFSFSKDLDRVAFVDESLTRPPEVKIWTRRNHSVRQVSNLNTAVAEKQMPRVRKVAWRSVDGAQVEGWLMEPASELHGPRPLLTFVHGGPGAQFANQFAFYFHFWPYPLEVLTAYNIAVFVPNYRGTYGYGVDHSSPSALDAEPVDDILTGIQYLVSEGVADKERLGIAGHSHGAWLGLTTMTRAKFFKVGAFAESVVDYVAVYGLTNDLFNRGVDDFILHTSLWDDPLRFVELSPDLHFKSVSAATLTETGALTIAPMMMLPVAKAAKYFGIPVESIVYPHTDHNPTIPEILHESAERNLEWFRFWLLGEEDPATAKSDQYVRWRAMRVPPTRPDVPRQ